MGAMRDLGQPQPELRAAVQAAMDECKALIAQEGPAGVTVQVESRLQVALNLLDEAQQVADAKEP